MIKKHPNLFIRFAITLPASR